MKLKPVFRENWLTKDPGPAAAPLTLALLALLLLGYFANLSATATQVFREGEYWRAWSTLFAHADPAHLLSNLFLFIPFAYLLAGYFSPWFFPVAGFFAGGLVNLAVLQALPSTTVLVGASGVVYWMGAAWITLAFLIDRRERVGKRVLKAIGVALLVFFPTTYRPEVSYLAHFLGFGAGVASALLYYAFARADFHAAEAYDYIWDLDALWDPERNAFSEALLLESFAPELSAEKCPGCES